MQTPLPQELQASPTGEAPAELPPDPRAQTRRRLILAAEIALVVIIIGLLVCIWLPSWIGPHPGVKQGAFN